MKVYWSRCGPRAGNFGDKLTPLLLGHLGVRCEWAPPEHAELIGVGSVLEKAPARFKGVVWSSGLMYAGSRLNLPQAEVLAVRGRLTLERLQCPRKERVRLGDGGLLCHLLHQPSVKKFKLGLVPHFVDFTDPVVAAIAARNTGITVIDVCRPPLEVIQAIGECEHILSSSLHGLVAADSLGVPNRWMELNRGPEKVWGAGFKFRDYHSIFGLSAVEPVRPSPADTLATLLPQFAGYARPGLEALQQGLLATLEQVAATRGRMDSQVAAGAMAVREAWMGRLPGAVAQLSRVLPASARFIFADDDQLRAEMAHPHAIPFLEREGEYWGPPATDAIAIAELERLRRAGARYLVFAWPAFWWLDHYVEFARHLTDTFACIHADADLVIYDLRD